MRHLLIKTLAGSGLLLLTLTASGQNPPRNEYGYQMDQREARDYDRFFERVRGDLDRASAAALPFTDERDRVTRAREEVSECQRALMAGDYDRRTFDEAIFAIQRVVDLNRLSDRNRDYLLDDVRELRHLRSRLEE